MSNKIGVWIDHSKAVIVSVSANGVTAKTLESQVGPHTKNLHPAGEKRREARYGEELDRYYREVIAQLGQPEALLIFGPGEAKVQLKERLTHSKALAACPVAIETTDKLKDPEIVAKVERYFEVG